MYAKDRVDPSEITSYEDLADPKWQGRICIRSSTNVYNQSLVASMIEADGHRGDRSLGARAWSTIWRARLRAATPTRSRRSRPASATSRWSITTTSCACSRVEAAEERAIGDKVGILFPNQDGRGAHANISGAGVIATAPNKDNAIKFLEYLTTPQAQAYFAQGNYEFPVVEGVKLDPVLEQWGDDQDRRRSTRRSSARTTPTRSS